jgi:hypothetical protein
MDSWSHRQPAAAPGPARIQAVTPVKVAMTRAGHHQSATARYSRPQPAHCSKPKIGAGGAGGADVTKFSPRNARPAGPGVRWRKLRRGGFEPRDDPAGAWSGGDCSVASRLTPHALQAPRSGSGAAAQLCGGVADERAALLCQLGVASPPWRKPNSQGGRSMRRDRNNGGAARP